MATDLSRLRLLPALWLATAPVWAFGPAGADVPFASAPASPAAETGAVAVVSNAVQAAATNAPASKPHASDAAPKAPDAKRAGLGGLTNRVWKLTALTGLDTLPAGAEVTLTVAGGRVSGRSACNHYFGRAKAEDSGALAVDGIGSTLMACEEPIMKLEARYLELLGKVTAWAVRDGNLVLTAGEAELRFAPRPPEK